MKLYVRFFLPGVQSRFNLKESVKITAQQHLQESRIKHHLYYRKIGPHKHHKKNKDLES